MDKHTTRHTEHEIRSYVAVGFTKPGGKPGVRIEGSTWEVGYTPGHRKNRIEALYAYIIKLQAQQEELALRVNQSWHEFEALADETPEAELEEARKMFREGKTK